MVRDITERKQAEGVLRINERAVYRMAQARRAMWQLGIKPSNTEFLGNSDEAKRIYGLISKSQIGQRMKFENCISDEKRVHQAFG